MVALSSVGKVSYGMQKSPANRPGKHARPYLRVANVQRGTLDLAEMKYMDVPDEDMHKLRLMDSDVLLCEGNSLDLVGRGAIWRNEIQDCIHQNHVLRVRVDQGLLSPDFLLEVSALPLPLPPLAEQKVMLDALHKGTEEAKAEAAKAEVLRNSAWAAFESALFEP
jgi:type I restriction enzyme S subunit